MNLGMRRKMNRAASDACSGKAGLRPFYLWPPPTTGNIAPVIPSVYMHIYMYESICNTTTSEA